MAIPEHPFVTAAKAKAESSRKAKEATAKTGAASREKIAGMRFGAQTKTAEARARTTGIKTASQERRASAKLASQETIAGRKLASQESVAGMRAGVQQERLEWTQEQAEKRAAAQKGKRIEKEVKEAGELGKRMVIAPVEALTKMPGKIRPFKFAGIVHPDQTVKNTEPYFGEGNDGKVRMPNGKTYSGDWRDLHQPGRVQTKEDAEAILTAYEKLGEGATMAEVMRETELDSHRIQRAIKFIEKSGFTVREV